MRSSFAKWLAGWAAAGLALALGWVAFQWFIQRHENLWGGNIGYVAERAMVITWPSSVWLLAADGAEGTPTAYFFLLLAVLGNVVVYGAIGMITWLLKLLATFGRK